jgi:hypothetical protein
MKVLNAITKKEELNADETEWVQVKFTQAHALCNKYLQKLNTLATITEFIASEITIEGFKSSFKALLSDDRDNQVGEVININLQVDKFVSLMREKYGMAIIDAQENSRPSTSTESQIFDAISIDVEKTKPLLMGMDPIILGLELHRKRKRSALKVIVDRELHTMDGETITNLLKKNPELLVIVEHELPRIIPSLDEATTTQILEAVVANLNVTGDASWPEEVIRRMNEVESSMKWKEVAGLKNEVCSSSCRPIGVLENWRIPRSGTLS